MTEKIISEIDLCFDARNHRVLSPFLFLTAETLNFLTQNEFLNTSVQDSSHYPFINQVIYELEKSILFEKYYGDDNELINEYNKSILTSFKDAISYESSESSIEKQFDHPSKIAFDQLSSLRYFLRQQKKLLKRNIKQMPISTARFPHFHQQTTNYLIFDYLDSESTENIQQDEAKLTEIITIDADKKELIVPFENLIDFYNILLKYSKAFSLSPTFVISTLNTFDIILKSFLCKNENVNDENIEKNDFLFFEKFRKFVCEISNEEEKLLKTKYFKLIMLIKMRLYLIIQRMHDSLIILIQFIIMEQEKINNENDDDDFSFKNLLCKSLPETKKRSKIIRNISSEQIFDFCLSSNGNNDFILTKDGVFKINETNEETVILEQIDFKEDENSKIQQMLKKCDKNKAKIAFSNGILYLLCNEDKMIHKVLISSYEPNKNQNEKKNDNMNKERDNQKSKEKITKHINKKLREKAKKEKKKQRRFERLQIEKVDENLDSFSINISEIYPIISINVYNNYLRILQRKNSIDNKAIFLFTNVNLDPNSITNFDVIETFKETENKEKISQTQFEIICENSKYKIIDACLFEDFIFFSFEDSLIEQWMIFQNGKVEKYKSFISPYILFPYSRQKVDDNLFLHILEPIDNDSICINKMYLKETKHYIRSESSIFLKYPYLQKLSDIVDNCSQFIINKEITKEITTEEYYRIKNQYDDETKKNDDQILDPNSFIVSPEEMCSIIQSLPSISSQIENIKQLINELKDYKLKNFFASLFIKMCGINFIYATNSYYSSKDPMSELAINRFKLFKSFILDLFSSTKFNNSLNNFEIMIKESIIFTFTLAGKFLFVPDCINELQKFIHELLFLNESENNNSVKLLNSLSKFIFSYPSSIYFIDNSFYNHLLGYEEIINLHELYSRSLYNILIEKRYSEKIMKNEFISFIDHYIQSLTQYILYMLKNESIPLIKTEQILAILIGLPIENCFYSLIIEKNLIEIAPVLYERIRKVEGVLESDQEFSKCYHDIQQQTVTKEVKIIESEHPFNYQPTKKEKKKGKKRWGESAKVVENIGVIEFQFNTDNIYCIFDNKCKLPSNYNIKISDDDRKIVFNNKNALFNRAISFKNNKVKVQLIHDGKLPDKQEWGYKIKFVGVSFNNPYYWLSNVHLNFYNQFIIFLISMYEYAVKSTPITKNENEFNFILNNKMIQGIKFEDIDNYETELQKEKENNNDDNKPAKALKRTLTRGISRGINYDTDNDSVFDDNYKKSFLKDLLTINENSNTRGKHLLDYLYSKTAKQNRIRLNESTKSILIIERYLAACLFKQLGLINLCLKHIDTIISSSNNIEIPSRLKSVWKMIYSLRQILFFSYQKSKVATNLNSKSLKLNFKLYSEEIKRKCILLLYSDPILKFKEKGNPDNEVIDSTAKSIFSFITSEIPLSNISDLIDIRRIRLTISTQAIKYLSSFMDKNLFFESTKNAFVKAFNFYTHHHYCFNGLSQRELDEFNKLYGSLTFKVVKTIYSKPSFSLICEHCFLRESVYKHEDIESRNECSKIFINVLENAKERSPFSREYTNFIIVCILITIAIENKNNELINYVINLLLLNEIDFQSKQLILTSIPAFYQIIPDNQKINDKSLVFTILSNNHNSPIIVRYIFYWLAYHINSTIELDNTNHEDLILKILKGIGQSFAGKSCLFIDESFQPFAHRQVAEGMISFIRLLVNFQNDKIINIIHKILTNMINKIKLDATENKDELMIVIGLFASVGQTLSSLKSERKIIKDDSWNSLKTVIGYNTSLSHLGEYDSANKKVYGAYSNVVSCDPRKIDLTDNEIDNILQLHENISKSKYFTEQQNYEINISESEIDENILISTFYSFLPVIMQNQYNSNLLMSPPYLNRALSFFEFSTKVLPTNQNSIIILSHYLEQAINNPLYQQETNKQISLKDEQGNFRFMKMNFGEIIYNNDNEKHVIIQTNKNHHNLFICTRPFDFNCKTYFEVKINKIGNKQIFIGFIDSNEFKLEKAFGFGSIEQSSLFYRISPYLSKVLIFSGDSISDDQENVNDSEKSILNFSDGDTIGCYYTNEFVYLTYNGKLTQYRLYHSTLSSYVPFISIDHDEIELEIVHNVTIIDDENNQSFNFLKISNLPVDYFNSTDITKTSEKEDLYFSKLGEIKEKPHLIGQQVYLCKTIASENKAKMETINQYSSEQLRYRENYGIIKDINPIENNQFVSKLKIESYNCNTLSNELINFDIDSRYIKGIETNFFNLIENRTNTKLGFNDSCDLKYLPQNLQKTFDFNIISNYLKSKTIKENSKSIALIMTRYLVFILVDYLRFSKSPLIQDEGIDTIEAEKIIKGLVFSLPTFTSFRPKFIYALDQSEIDQYCIFHDEDKEYIEKNTIIPGKLDNNFHKLPGFSKSFNKSFGAFLYQSVQFISPKFIAKILKGSIEKAMNDEIISCSSLYQNIPSNDKIESIYPLPEEFIISNEIQSDKFEDKRIIGYIPILLNSIPDILPSLICDQRRLRYCSDQVTYINFNLLSDIEMKWKYKISNLKKMRINSGKSYDPKNYKDFKLKFGILTLSKDLPENLLNNSLGFIQTIFNIFQAFNRSEILFDKHKDFLSNEFLVKFLSFAKKKNPIAYPFLQVIIVTLISKYGFSDSLFQQNADNASLVLENKTDKLFKIEEFPSSRNELPLLFSIYSNLCQTRVIELLSNNDKIKIASLFEKYEKINNELFQISDVEVSKNEKKFLEYENNECSNGWERRYGWRNGNESKSNKKKNFRSFYLVYYYSYLLNSDKKLPYPVFLFVHEWMMQSFGGFRTTISYKDINDFEPIEFDENNEIVYKSKVFENDCNLSCSYQQINIYLKNDEKDEDDSNDDFESSFYMNIGSTFMSAFNGYAGSGTNTNTNTNTNDEMSKENTFKIFIHQLSNDEKIEIVNGTNIVASFPLEIMVIHDKSNINEKIKKGDVFVVDFIPSEKDKEKFFVDNYEQIQNDFQDFINLSKYDNELFDTNNKYNNTIENTTINNENDGNISKESENNENENISNNDNENINKENNENENINDNSNNEGINNIDNENESTNNNTNENTIHAEDDTYTQNDNEEEENEDTESYNDYKIYELEKIPMSISVSIPTLPPSISPRIISLRYSIITRYNQLIENMMLTYTLNDNDDGSYSSTNWWSNSSLHTKYKPVSQYMHQIIGPAYSMKTESKFRFINNILKNEKKENYNLKLIFNRFEQQKFLNCIENKKENESIITARPLFVQLLEQVDDNSISLLKVRGAPPFKVNLVGEGAIDGGGPSREIFSSLIIEIMNEHLGIFTFNPNRRHMNKETNQEDLIPNTKAVFTNEFNEEVSQLLSKRFTFAGALIACCIVSSLPQPLKLSSIIWDFLSRGTVSIESIYEVDNNFKTLIENCEDIEKYIPNLNEVEFKNSFMHSFEIQNSFDELIELVPSGSKIEVTIENLHEFIQLAKKTRIHEFDRQLNEIKDGFDRIMSYKNITSILHPNELKLLVCGEPSCSIEQMKKLTKISTSSSYNEKISGNDLIQMFWNVMSKFSPEDRMQFIKFSTGNLGLPAPGLKWDTDLTIEFKSLEEKEEKGNKMLHSSTCMSVVEIPFFESEEELEKMIRQSLKFSGMISDNDARLEDVAEFL